MFNTTSNYWQQLARNLYLGKILYRLYYLPKGFLKKCLRVGAINMAVDHIEKQRMEKAVYQLPTIPQYSNAKPLKIYFLSGKKFWYQTCFCAYSLAQQAKVNIQPVVYDDGTLKPKYAAEIRRIFPNAEIVFLSEIEALLEQFLPKNKFPYLRERRLNYPNIRKLTDIHVGSSNWKLVLDSDMLFFQNPTLLVNWLQSPQQPCYMVDTETSYGYSETLMNSLAGATIPERLNVGICGLKSDNIDWEKLEFWCRKTIEKEGTNYYQEQALIAMLLAQEDCLVAPAQDYIVMPNQVEGMNPQAVLHHYVADSKSWYFRCGWKRVIKTRTF